MRQPSDSIDHPIVLSSDFIESLQAGASNGLVDASSGIRPARLWMCCSIGFGNLDILVRERGIVLQNSLDRPSAIYQRCDPIDLNLRPLQHRLAIGPEFDLVGQLGKVCHAPPNLVDQIADRNPKPAEANFLTWVGSCLLECLIEFRPRLGREFIAGRTGPRPDINTTTRAICWR